MLRQHAQSEQGKIVLDRILRVKSPEVFGEFEHGAPVGLRAVQQTQLSSHALHVHIERDEQLCGFYFFPNAEIHASRVAPNHPAQEHIESLASGASLRGSDVFAGSFRRVRVVEKVIVKTAQGIFYRRVAGEKMTGKSRFERGVFSIKLLKKFEKPKCVRCLERAVFEIQKSGAILFQMIDNEIVRRAVHQFDEAVGVLNNCLALSPGEGSCPECRDFAILQCRKMMRHRNGVARNKFRLIVTGSSLVEESGKRRMAGGRFVHVEAKITRAEQQNKNRVAQ